MIMHISLHRFMHSCVVAQLATTHTAATVQVSELERREAAQGRETDEAGRSHSAARDLLAHGAATEASIADYTGSLSSRISKLRSIFTAASEAQAAALRSAEEAAGYKRGGVGGGKGGRATAAAQAAAAAAAAKRADASHAQDAADLLALREDREQTLARMKIADARSISLELQVSAHMRLLWCSFY
jgi:hypothetical protein